MSSRKLPRLMALAAFLGSATVVGLAAQPPGEQEDPKGTVKKKITVEDDPGSAKKGKDALTASAPDVRLDELVKAAEETRDPTLKALFTKFMVPFDRVTEKSGGMRVQPVPVLKAEWPESVGLFPLDGKGKPQEVRTIRAADIRTIDYFEGMIHADVDNLLKEKAEGTAALNNLVAAEKLLAAASRFHEYAREHTYPNRKTPIRSGKGWDPLRLIVNNHLRETRLDLLRAAIAANDAARVRDISTRLMDAYPKDAAVAQAVAAARMGEAERLVQSASHLDHVRAKELLDEFEARFPGAGGDAARKLRGQLRDMAQKAFTRAREKKASGDLTTARDELARAAALDPTIDGVRDMQRELRSGYPILYVGVRQFPQNLSPITARVDSEKQAVELIFEGLLEEAPEESGAVHYRPGAVVNMPLAISGGRDCLLRTFERDATGRPGFDSHDMVGTVKHLQTRSDTWAAYPLQWFDQEPPTPRDVRTVRLKFGAGHPDPRALLTFKLLPTRWLDANSKPIDDAAFAEKPFGTGPFRVQGRNNPEPGAPRELVFVDNPAYGRWRDRTGLPYLREIHLIEVAKLDPVAAFRDDKLHILTDVPTGDLDKFTGAGSGIAGKVQVVTATSNRRVHILAVNLNRPYLQGREIRQGLSMAIDRDEILREVFRAGRADVHKPMIGPYPPGSWAGPKSTAARALVDRDLAVVRFKSYLADAGAKTDFSLAYPDDDPRAAAACARIKSQIEGLMKDLSRKLVINLEGVPLRDLMIRVQDEHRYDLAYIPFDYPDDWHPFALGAALDPAAAGRGGRNWFSFRTGGTNPDPNDQKLGEMLDSLRLRRDPAQLANESVKAVEEFNKSLPFIPLWQLDRHMVIHNGLKVFVDDSTDPVSPRLLNQTPLFQGVARWRLE